MGQARAAVFSLIGSFAEARLVSASVAPMALGRRRNCGSRSARGSWLPTPSSLLTATLSSSTWSACSRPNNRNVRFRFHAAAGIGSLRPTVLLRARKGCIRPAIAFASQAASCWTSAMATSESRRLSRTGAGLTIAFASAGLRRRRRARLRNATRSAVSPGRRHVFIARTMRKADRTKLPAVVALLL